MTPALFQFFLGKAATAGGGGGPVAFVQGKGTRTAVESTTSSSLTFDTTTTTDNYIVVCATTFAFNDAPDLTPSADGVTFTSIQNVLLPSYFRLQAWVGKITSGQASHQVTMALSGGPVGNGGGGNISWSIAEFSGVHDTTPVSFSTNNNGSSTTITTGTLTVADAGSMVVMCLFQDTGSDKTLTPDATNWPATNIYENESASSGPIFGSYYRSADTDVNAEVDTSGSSTWYAIGFVLKPAPEPGAPISGSGTPTAQNATVSASGTTGRVGTAAVQAGPAGGANARNQYALKVSDNGHYLVEYATGTPFFWIGDTAWEMCHRSNTSEVDTYMLNRAQKGFTIVQIVGIAELGGPYVKNAVNSTGYLPFTTHEWIGDTDADYTIGYWNHVDYIIDKAASYGMRVAFLPTWASWITDTSTYSYFYPGTGTFEAGNIAGLAGATSLEKAKTRAYNYGRWLGERYWDKPIIWVMGGDRADTALGDGDSDSVQDMVEILRSMASGIVDGVVAGGGVENEVLITYHADYSRPSSAGLDDETWLDFHTYQPAHFRRADEEIYVRADNDWALGKPTLCIEANYENQTAATGPWSGNQFNDYDQRLAAYWSTFAGSHGFTYGCRAIWQLYLDDTTTNSQGVPNRTPVAGASVNWTDSSEIDATGAGQLKYLKWLLSRTGRPYLTRIPDQSLITSTNTSGDDVTDYHRATRDSSDGTTSGSCTYAMIYLGEGGTVNINLTKFQTGSDVRAWWFNPRTGAATLDTNATDGIYDRTQASQLFTAPASGVNNDYVLVLDSIDSDYNDPSFPVNALTVTITASSATASGSGTVTSSHSGTAAVTSQESTVVASGTTGRSGTSASASDASSTSASVNSGRAGTSNSVSDASSVSSTGGTGREGTSASVSGDSSASGSGSQPKSGTSTSVSQDASVSVSGSTGRTGTSTSVSGDATASGTASQDKTGTSASVSDAASVSASGTTGRTGTSDSVSDASTVSGSGNHPRSGTSSSVSAESSVTASGSTGRVGSSSVAASDATVVSSGTSGRAASSTATSDDSTTSASGTSGRVGSSVSVSEPATVVGSGSVSGTVVGTSDSVSSDAIISASGLTWRSGTSSVVSDAASVAASGSAGRSGSASVSSGDSTASGYGSVEEGEEGYSDSISDASTVQGTGRTGRVGTAAVSSQEAKTSGGVLSVGIIDIPSVRFGITQMIKGPTFSITLV